MGHCKKTTNCTYNLSPVEAYHLIVKGKLKKFPNGFLDKNSCKEIIRYIVLDTLKMSREDICTNFNAKFLQQYYVGGVRKKFENSISKIIAYCFDDLDIKPWELKKVENTFWHNPENQREFILWIAKKENLNLDILSDVQKITSKLISKYHGSKARIASGGTYELINSVICDKFQEWEVLKIDIWTEEKAKRAVQWLIEEKLHWNDEEIFNCLTANIFRKNHLGGLLKNFCGNSPLAAINIAYPGKFKNLKYSTHSKI